MTGFHVEPSARSWMRGVVAGVPRGTCNFDLWSGSNWGHAVEPRRPPARAGTWHNGTEFDSVPGLAPLIGDGHISTARGPASEHDRTIRKKPPVLAAQSPALATGPELDPPGPPIFERHPRGGLPLVNRSLSTNPPGVAAHKFFSVGRPPTGSGREKDFIRPTPS